MIYKLKKPVEIAGVNNDTMILKDISFNFKGIKGFKYISEKYDKIKQLAFEKVFVKLSNLNNDALNTAKETYKKNKNNLENEIEDTLTALKTFGYLESLKSDLLESSYEYIHFYDGFPEYGVSKVIDRLEIEDLDGLSEHLIRTILLLKKK